MVLNRHFPGLQSLGPVHEIGQELADEFTRVFVREYSFRVKFLRGEIYKDFGQVDGIHVEIDKNLS